MNLWPWCGPLSYEGRSFVGRFLKKNSIQIQIVVNEGKRIKCYEQYMR